MIYQTAIEPMAGMFKQYDCEENLMRLFLARVFGREEFSEDNANQHPRECLLEELTKLTGVQERCNVTLESYISHGAHGMVFCGVGSEGRFAVKLVTLPTEQALEGFKREIINHVLLQKTLPHRVIKVREFFPVLHLSVA